MRFLLTPTRRSVTRIARTKGEKRPRSESLLPDHANAVSINNKDDKVLKMNSWGQQCSPSCGCVLRFESNVDPSTNTVVGSSYSAKAVVATKSKDGYLKPVLTTRNSKPMFKECECKTLHTLAKEVVTFLPKKRLDQLKNMTEFSFTRSSPAFRHTVLVENNLPREDTHCFDIVEEAFTAMLKGNMPKQRRNTKSFHQLLVNEFVLNQPENNNEQSFDKKDLGIDRTRLSLSFSSSRSLSSLRMLDVNDDFWDNDAQHHYDGDYEDTAQQKETLDWVSYVDEKYQSEESA